MSNFIDFIDLTDHHDEPAYKYFDNDTYDFLVELNIVCYGLYHGMFDYAVQNPHRLHRMIQSSRRQWRTTLGKYNPNTFQIVKAIRLGILKRNP